MKLPLPDKHFLFSQCVLKMTSYCWVEDNIPMCRSCNRPPKHISDMLTLLPIQSVVPPEYSELQALVDEVKKLSYLRVLIYVISKDKSMH